MTPQRIIDEAEKRYNPLLGRCNEPYTPDELIGHVKNGFIAGAMFNEDHTINSGREELEKENHELLLQVLHYQQIGLKNLETITALQSSLKEKDLIIHGIEEGSQQWEQEYKDCRKILQDIIEAESHQWNRSSVTNPSQLPLVLQAAKDFLSKYQHQ